MLEVPVPSLLAANRPGRLALLLGRLIGVGYRIAGRHRYDDFRLEQLLDMRLLVLPTVANPRLLRTGAFFAAELERQLTETYADVLDLGTGSGICALVAARHARRVVGVDINPAAVRCASINALMNRSEERIELRQGDLFSPVAGERFDLVLFNPPFLLGEPAGNRDAAWRSTNTAERFAAGLSDHLKPSGFAVLLLSSFGDACIDFETALRRQGFRLDVFAQRRYINETVTILRVGEGRP